VEKAKKRQHGWPGTQAKTVLSVLNVHNLKGQRPGDNKAF
jgi:hypothetical protein